MALPHIKVFVNYLDEGSARSMIKFVGDMNLDRITKYFYNLEVWPESKNQVYVRAGTWI